MHIGVREVVLGENQKNPDGQFYLVAYCEANELFAIYSDCLVSDSFPEIVKEFGQRVAQEAQKVMEQIHTEKEAVSDNRPYTAEVCKKMVGCNLVSGDDPLEGKCVIIKQDVLRREYRTAAHQLKLVTGGFGASPHSRGSAVYCTDLFTGENSRFERQDILAEISQDALPQWASKTLQTLLRPKQEKGKEER